MFKNHSAAVLSLPHCLTVHCWPFAPEVLDCRRLPHLFLFFIFFSYAASSEVLLWCGIKVFYGSSLYYVQKVNYFYLLQKSSFLKTHIKYFNIKSRKSILITSICIMQFNISYGLGGH